MLFKMKSEVKKKYQIFKCSKTILLHLIDKSKGRNTLLVVIAVDGGQVGQLVGLIVLKVDNLSRTIMNQLDIDLELNQTRLCSAYEMDFNLTRLIGIQFLRGNDKIL